MTDSFADLWNSTAPTKPAEAPRRLGAIPSAVPNPPKPQNDVFSLLAAAGSTSSSSSRSITPSYTGGTQPSRSNVSKPLQKPVSSGGDAFSGLLSGSLSSNSTNGANLTIAERAAQAERHRMEQIQRQQTVVKQQSAAWAGLDTLAGSSLTQPVVAKPSNQLPKDDWEFGFDSTQPATVPAAASPHPAATSDDWGLDEFVSKPATSKISQPQPKSLWDFDDLASSSPQAASQQSPEPSIHRSRTPGDFDFGDREDGLLNDRSGDEDDILGALGKPVDKIPPIMNQPARSTPSPQPPSGQRSRAVSPPPHIIGQIVEMGFSPQQARVALAATDTGVDVQAALDNLLSNGAGSDSPPIPHDHTRTRRSDRQRQHHRHSDPADSDETPASRREPQRREREGAARDPPLGASDTQHNLQEQADKLIAQASEIGLSVFSRANALWKEGKEKVQRAYEERATASVAGARASGPATSRRPKWMQDDAEHEGGDEEDGIPPANEPQPKSAESRPKHQPQREPEPASTSSRVKTGNLFSDDPPAVYVSPFRRKAPSRSQADPPSKTVSRVPTRAPSPIPLIQRRTVRAQPSAVAASAKHKTAGTEMYKLGRYAEAETSYSSAIAALPDSHLLLVPLYNNRALTRMKIGDHSGAIEDCTAVIALIGPTYNPAREAKVANEDEGAGVDLGDGLVKALRRRAEAFEGKEKWDNARKDWEAIAAADWAGKVRGEAVRGVGRCRKMLSADTDSPAGPSVPSVAPSRPKPKPRPVQRGPTPPSEALNRVRQANKVAEAEDQAKHDLKDSVDARVAAWKKGKETNIRALVASLDTVLWPELGWQKVGMHELVTPAQVKIRYTKAIAKLHPDKLNVNNTTVEQRMVANEIFGSLNDAWNAFKQ